jgi:hypothetical protein
MSDDVATPSPTDDTVVVVIKAQAKGFKLIPVAAHSKDRIRNLAEIMIFCGTTKQCVCVDSIFTVHSTVEECCWFGFIE